MSEENKAILSRYIEEAWNKHNPGITDEFYAPDVVNRSAPPGAPNDREGLKAGLGMFLGAFPDVKIMPDFLMAEGDKVAMRWTMTATHTGEWMGIPATGKRMEMTGITIARVADGKLAEVWFETDSMGMMQQLGAVPTPGG